MEWSERMNSAIAYIEDNLAGEIDFSEAAKKACCSPFHFQRMFLVINGVTPAEYARRRKLTLAARELTSGSARVIDVAMKYGYDSPDAFTRAFRNLHGINPQAARRPGATLTAFPRISFSIILKGGSDMDYRLIEKPAFDVIGRGRKFSTVNMEQVTKIPQFWNEFVSDENGERVLLALTEGRPGPITGGMELGICHFPDTKPMQEFYYSVGVEKPGETVPDGFEVIHIPAATWAVFESVGPMPGAIQEVSKRVFTEWFPSTGYEHAPNSELEVYLPGDPRSASYHCQVWIPIIKKKRSGR